MTAKIEQWMIDAMKSLHCEEYYTDAMAERDARHIAAYAPKEKAAWEATAKENELRKLDYDLLSADYKQLGIEITNYRNKEKALRGLAEIYRHCTWEPSVNPGEEFLAILNREQEKQT